MLLLAGFPDKKTAIGRCLPAMVAALVSLPLHAQIDVGDDAQLQEVHISAPADQKQGYTLRTLHKLEHMRDNISKQVGQLGRATDNWLAGETESDEKNESYLRLRLHDDFFKGGNRDSEYSLRGHLDLPRTQKRWRLFFDTDNADLNSLEDKKLAHEATGDNITGLSRDNETRWFTVRHDAGVSGHLPLDPFYRFKFKTGKQLDALWRADFEQRLWYYQSKRWGEKSKLAFSKPIGNRSTLQIATDVQFQDRYDKFEFGQYVSLVRQLEPMESIHYELGALGESQPERNINTYFIQAGYSRSLREDWVVFTVTPQLAFPRTDDWKPNPGLFLTLDIYFYAL